MDVNQVAELGKFVEQLKSNPSILHDPSLSFFKEYLQSLEAQVPNVEKPEKDNEDKAETKTSSSPKHDDDDDDDDIIESDVELDNSDVVEPDNDPPQPMGDPTVEVTDENRDAAQSLKEEALRESCRAKFDEAIDLLTKAIMLNPTSANLYANRAHLFVAIQKPNAAIRDAEVALQLNPDSAPGYKSRGIARSFIGLYEEAAADLREGSKLDYDEDIELKLKKVEVNVKRIEEHRRKYQRLRKEKELQRAERERREQQEAQEREALSALKDGQVISIHSTSELEAKTKTAKKVSRLVIIYFTAAWCGPCRYMSPLYSNLATQHPSVVFLKVDIDEASDVAASWNISSVPTFCFIRDGKQVDKVVGANKGQLMDGNTRRLPPWMVAGGSSGVTTTSNRTDDKSIDVKTIHESDGAPVTKGEKRPRRTVKPKERDDSDGPKKVGIKRKGGERARRIKTDEEEPKPSIGGDVKNPEIIQSVTGPKDEDLTVDDLLSFAQEYVKGEEDQTSTERESSSIDKSMLVVDESSNMRLSQGETEEPNGTRDPTADDMLSLLLGPFFKGKN